MQRLWNTVKRTIHGFFYNIWRFFFIVLNVLFREFKSSYDRICLKILNAYLYHPGRLATAEFRVYNRTSYFYPSLHEQFLKHFLNQRRPKTSSIGRDISLSMMDKIHIKFHVIIRTYQIGHSTTFRAVTQRSQKPLQNPKIWFDRRDRAGFRTTYTSMLEKINYWCRLATFACSTANLNR